MEWYWNRMKNLIYWVGVNKPLYTEWTKRKIVLDKVFSVNKKI